MPALLVAESTRMSSCHPAQASKLQVGSRGRTVSGLTMHVKSPVVSTHEGDGDTPTYGSNVGHGAASHQPGETNPSLRLGA